MTTPNANTPVFPCNARAIAKSNTARFSPCAIYVGTAGTAAVIPADAPESAGVSFVMQAGSTIPVMVVGVLSTGTTAGDLVALY